jgi:hypothetical protein
MMRSRSHPRVALAAFFGLMWPVTASAATDCLLGQSIGVFVAHAFTDANGGTRQGTNYGPIYGQLSGRLSGQVGTVMEIGASSGREALAKTKDRAGLLAFFELNAQASDIPLLGGQRTSMQSINLQANLRIIDAVNRTLLGTATDMVSAAGLSIEATLPTVVAGLVDRLTDVALKQACSQLVAPAPVEAREVTAAVEPDDLSPPSPPEAPVSKGSASSLRDIVRSYFNDSRSFAVVIGINSYTREANGYHELPYAVHDATAVTDFMVTKLGLNPHRVYSLLDRDATRQNIQALLGDKLPREVTSDDRVIVYFSGHGETTTTPSGDQYGYLIPIDGDRGALHSTAISMTEIKTYSDLMPAKQMFFIIDACYSGIAGFFSKGGDAGAKRELTERQIAIFSESRGRQIITAGTAKEQSFMGQEWDNHSVFTYYLLRGLQGEADYTEDDVITADELKLYLSNEVSLATDNRQNPQMYSIDLSQGQFIFYQEGQF